MEIVVGIPDTVDAVTLVEATRQLGIARDEHAHDITHAFAVGILTGAAGGDQVMPILMVHHHREGGVVAATAQGIEVDRRIVVEGIAWTR